MTDWLDAMLIWAAAKLPESKAGWVEDLRREARHVPGGIPRFQFLSGGVFAALGELLRINVGPKRVGQGLVGLALFGLCMSVGMAALASDSKIVQTALLVALPIYGVAVGLVVFNLRLMRLYTVCCSLTLAAISAAFWLPAFDISELPIRFLRAFTFEGALIMAALLVAAIYLSWIEDARHA